jgi:hypothetical protein
MEQHIVVVLWTTRLEHPLSATAWQIANEALCVSVWRAGSRTLACRVMPEITHMMIQMPAGQQTTQLIEWVRAAARFAVVRATAGISPCWEDAYTYSVVDGLMVVEEIIAPLTLVSHYTA